jgi:nitrite reductase/ring-hydroxylating ferredoxin subunit
MSQHRSLVIHDVAAKDLPSIGFEEIKKRTLGGEVFVVRRGLQSAGCFQEMADTSLEGIRRAAGQEAAGRVAELGFEKMHEVIKGGDAYRVMDASYALYKERTHALSKQIIGHLFGARQFYYEDEPNVRYHIPFDETRHMDDELADFKWSGKIVPHGPHHDSWYYCPSNCLDVWMAVGRVVKGNGLSIFPDIFGKYLPCDEKGVVKRNQSFGSPENFDLNPGDILLFCGEHFHSSELNATSLTRHVVSLRITFDRPVFVGNSPYKYSYKKAVIRSGRLARIDEAAWQLKNRSASFIANRLRTSNQTRFVIAPSELPSCDSFEHKPAIDPDDEKFLRTADITFDEVQKRLKLEPNSVKAVSRSLCAARSEEQIILFSRFCPHQGADLSAGHVDGSTLSCPWHNLRLDLSTGQSMCTTLRGLKIVRTWGPEAEPLKLTADDNSAST